MSGLSDGDQLAQCQIEDGLASLARVRKLLDVIEIKAKYVEPADLRQSMQKDIAEAKQAATEPQKNLSWLLRLKGWMK